MPLERQHTRRQASPLHLALPLQVAWRHDFTNYFPPTPYSVVLFSVLRLQTASSALQGAIQLGIGYTVGNLSSKPERDVLMQDFYVVESIFFPRFVCMSGFVFNVHVCGRYLIQYFILIYSSCWSHLAPYSEGSNLTPAHHYSDFRFKTYAPVAFRYFRELFGIRPDDYLVRYLFSLITGDALRVSECLMKCYASEMFSVTYSINSEGNIYTSHNHLLQNT